MDMEYCHTFGYLGLKVYNAVWASEEEARSAELDSNAGMKPSSDKEPLMYWYPKHGKWQKKGNEYTLLDGESPTLEASEKTQAEHDEALKRMGTEGLKGQLFDENAQPAGAVQVRCLACVTNHEETKLYERWMRQVERTERAVCDARLKLLPMFHYDPRRWQSKGIRVQSSPIAAGWQGTGRPPGNTSSTLLMLRAPRLPGGRTETLPAASPEAPSKNAALRRRVWWS